MGEVDSPRSADLDPVAAQALKQFVKKNRPGPTQPATLPYLSEPVPEGLPADASTDAVQAVPSIDTSSLAPSIRKFDIFDNIDEDRVQEFESLFAEARAASNYDEFRNKAKKADPNKFMTSSGVNVKEDGVRVLT
mmetsp:Transcript_159035/g.486731  ORF Transcript_159035/g.486731 Transcript_159035/m.486731 type:complete len:135 (+) Transcript_159035:132-536(+)